MNDFLKIPAPAKINLFLHVIGRRSDGYHLLQSVFRLIDLQDEVLLRPRSDSAIVRLNPLQEVPPNSDLIVRAAKLLQERTGIKRGVDLDLIKRIPMGAGLGGGSSDAASTLIGLNSLWNTGLTREELASVGLQLGADVPFFIHGKNAFVEGIGEHITPIQLPEARYILIFPGVGVPTPEVFQDPGLTRNRARITMADFVEHHQTLESHHSTNAMNEANDVIVVSFGVNDLQDVVVRKHPEVKKALDWLLEHIPGASPRMSGSGSTVFTQLPNSLDFPNAQTLLTELPKSWFGFCVRGLSEHPAYNLITQQGNRQAG